MRLAPCSLFPALLAVASLASAQPANLNYTRLTNGTYSRSHDYDLVHQRISVGDFNWDSLSFVGRVATTLVARQALDSVILDAGSRLGITSVTTPSRATLRSDHRGDTLVVFLGKPARTGDTVRFTIDYDARIANGHGLTFIGERPPLHTPRQIWSQGESMDNHF